MTIIQKIWHTGHASIVFEIYSRETKKYFLIFNADEKKFIYTQKVKPTDKKTNNNFILILKKYFLNSLVTIDLNDNNYAAITVGEIKLLLSNKADETAVFKEQKLLLLYKKNYQINEENILLKKQKKQQKLLANLNNDLLKWESYIKREHEADLIKNNLHLVKPGDKILVCIDYSLEPFKEIAIALDHTCSIKIYLEKLYKNIKKAKRAINIIKERIILAKSHINLNQNLVPSTPIKAKSSKRLAYKEFLSSDDIKILVGKSGKDSDQMLKFNTNGNDFWFHVKDQAGSHVIVKYAKDDLPMNTLLEASMLALYFSKNKDKVGTVQYTKVKWVKKQKHFKPGQVIISQEKTISIKIDDQTLKTLLNMNY